MLLLKFKIDILSNHIDHIEITNFKSIRHAKIEGCKRINVFIGYPNVGKSAILEAISSLSYLQNNFKQDLVNLCRIKESFELFHDGTLSEDARIEISDDIQLAFKYISEKDLELTIGVFAESNQITPTYKRSIVFSKGLIGSDGWNLEKLGLNVKKYIFNTDYNEFKTNGLTLFSPYGQNLVDIIQSNKKLRKEVGELFKFYNLKLLIDQGTNSIRGLKQLDEETIFTVPFYQMAETLQRLIFHKAAIMSNEDSVLLFEEPEAHMFPPYISQLTSDIIFDKDNGNQYFVSTHSPFVMNDFLESAREDLSVYLVSLNNGETVIKRLSDEEVHKIYQYGVDLFFNIESYID